LIHLKLKVSVIEGSMERQTYIDRYSPIFLRNHYREKVLADQAGWFLADYNLPATFPPMSQKGWCQYPAQPDFVYAYFRLLALGEVVTLQALSATQPESVTSVRDDRPILCWLMENDIHRVIAPVAIAAWLSIDEFRWHHHIPGIPEDLHYGLVTHYPEAIACYAAFIGGFNRNELLSQIPNKTIVFYEDLAASEVSEQIGVPYQRIRTVAGYGG
jgi:hypothetical protein